MNIIILCVFYPPLKSSAAIQISDLTSELSLRGNKIIVITPDHILKKGFSLLKESRINTLRVKTGKLRDIGLTKRAINEFLMPFQIIYRIRKLTPILKNNDLIIWWSPSIFLTPVVIYLKIISKSKSYLILRDIFPQWAIDLGIIKNNFIAFAFKLFYYFQFLAADIVGIQSSGDRVYVPKRILRKKVNLEILNNWYSPTLSRKKSKLDLSNTFLNNRKIFVYAGNIGLAQDVKLFIDLAKAFRKNNEIGFLFIGRGSLYENLKNIINKNSLKNVLLHEEISNLEIQNIYHLCFAGLISLNCKHKTHNIPGKFISYLHSGLPVFGVVNDNNDIIDLINSNNLGFATSSNEIKNLKVYFLDFIKKIQNDLNINSRCKEFATENYNSKKISKQILSSVKNLNSKR